MGCPDRLPSSKADMAEPNPIQGSGRPQRLTLALLLKWPYAGVGSAVVFIFILAGVFGPFVAPYDPQDGSITHRLEAPSGTHPFGTDYLGRDVLSRMLWASRALLFMGLIGVGAGASAGVLSGLAFSRGVGKLAKFMRGLMRFSASIPIVGFPLCAILILVMPSVVVLTGTGYGNVILFIAIVISLRLVPSFYAAWLPFATAMDRGAYDSSPVPSDVMVARQPLLMLILAGFGLAVGMAIFLESISSFLGLLSAPDPSLGRMLDHGLRRGGGVAEWGTILSGIAVLVGILGFALLAYGVREFYDTAVQPERPWFYRTWFLILVFFLWPIWSLLIMRSPWHTGKRRKVLALFLVLVGGHFLVAYLFPTPSVAILASVPILIYFVVILMRRVRVRLTTARRI